MEFYDESMLNFMGGHMWIFWLILIVLVLIGLKVIFQQRGDSESALEILKKRYAKGEITKEEFEEQKKTLLS
ncbi:SHOCT domain-containing protein [Thiomicrorhabdus sediminis]|uniref:SHOCT domain-containing protein n=1 Tax=Thiomicrorhabdus sediminis TaxID=2580412 RepID=A0A4P9K7F4_9GAMM|nr:SHOCT domain-containing protein [Thiomicrorhabdus sediminis]QCU90979.1 SHOCT domain-containing protein [Thiomicrorhabdus sediminis]